MTAPRPLSPAPFVSVLCPTWQRPRELGFLIRCFERQDYPAHLRELIVLDDAGQYRDTCGPGWRLISVTHRYATLGEKRNALARLATPAAAVLLQWDDDDLYLPWHITATVAALQDADWSRPSEALRYSHEGLHRVRTWNRSDQADKAFIGGWGIRRDAFWRVGGYPAASTNEDKLLARKLIETGTTEADPVALGHRPAYVWAPHGGDHLSGHPIETGYRDWGQRSCKPAELVVADPPMLDLDNPVIFDQILPRPFAGDWS